MRGLIWTFQSAPLTEARGDFLSGVSKHPPSFFVSIRSPYRSKGRSVTAAVRASTTERFNPLPLPKQGEILGVPRRLARGADVSIRSPYRSKGRFRLTRNGQPIEKFQSAPLTEARGDGKCSRCSDRRVVFQSAPLTEARGDLDSSFCASVNVSCFNPLPLPKQGETP